MLDNLVLLFFYVIYFYFQPSDFHYSTSAMFGSINWFPPRAANVNWVSIGSDNGLSLTQHQAII